MIQTRESLLSTIRALLEMTEARGCTKAEAGTARAKAFELIDKHGVSLNDLLSIPSPISWAPPAPANPETRPEPDPDQRRASKHRSTPGVYSNEAFVQGVVSHKRGGGDPSSRLASMAVGFGFIALVCWLAATFYESLNDGGRSLKAGYVFSPSPAQSQSAIPRGTRLKVSNGSLSPQHLQTGGPDLSHRGNIGLGSP